MFKQFMKIYGIVYSVIIVIVIVFVIVDFGAANTVMDTYEANTGKGKNSFPKQLDFLISYTSATGDFTLFESTGLSKEEALAAMQQRTGTNPGGPDPDPNNGGSNGAPTPFTQATVDDAITQHCTSWGMSNTAKGSALWEKKTVNNVIYIYQHQNIGYMPIGFSGNTVDGCGCMMFAMSAIISNKTGKVFGIEDMLKGLGHNIVWDNGFKDSPTTVKNVGLGNPNWNHPDGTNCNPTSVLPKFGVNCVEKGKTLNDIDSIVSQNHYALVHVVDSSGTFTTGQHWFVVVGKSGGSYNAICLASTRTGHTFDAAKWANITSCSHVYDCY